MESIIITIIWAAVIQGLFLGVIFITSKKHRSFANKLLGFFLLAFVFQALTDILPFNKIGGYSIAGYFTLPEVKWLLPLLFLHFVLEKVGRSSHYKWFLKIHYVLAFGMIGLTGVNILLVLINGTTLLDVLGWGLIDPLYMSLQYYAFFLTIAAFVIALQETRRYCNLVKNEYSDFNLVNINWLWQFIFLMAPIIIIWGMELARIATGGRGQSELITLIFLFVAFFNYFVSYKAFMQQTLFDGTVDTLKTNNSELAMKDKSTVSVDLDVCLEIENAMRSNEYYLDQNLTIHDLSKRIKIPARTISTCLNQNAGYNFNEWVNNFRVDKALTLLKDENSCHLSIEGVGTEAGFRSRSAMYAAFKKKTGKSPGQFRTA